MHTWDIMDTTVQTLSMLRATKRGVDRSGLHPALTVKSDDGADVMMDVTIKYQIAEGKAWEVLNKFGKRERAEIDVTIAQAADAVEMIATEGVERAMNTFN